MKLFFYLKIEDFEFDWIALLNYLLYEYLLDVTCFSLAKHLACLAHTVLPSFVI